MTSQSPARAEVRRELVARGAGHGQAGVERGTGQRRGTGNCRGSGFRPNVCAARAGDRRMSRDDKKAALARAAHLCVLYRSRPASGRRGGERILRPLLSGAL